MPVRQKKIANFRLFLGLRIYSIIFSDFVLFFAMFSFGQHIYKSISRIYTKNKINVSIHNEHIYLLFIIFHSLRNILTGWCNTHNITLPGLNTNFSNKIDKQKWTSDVFTISLITIKPITSHHTIINLCFIVY